jgi:hypothetical protein
MDDLERYVQAERDKIRWQAQQYEKRRAKLDAYLQDCSKNPAMAPRWLLRRCRADHCDRFADFLDGRCSRHHERYAKHGDERISRQLVYSKERGRYMAQAAEILQRHGHDGRLRNCRWRMVQVMTWNHASRLAPSHRRQRRREQQLNAAMALVMGAGFKPNWLLQVLLAFYMWEKEQPVYPNRVLDVTLARWLLAYVDIDQREKQSLLCRARFLVYLGA